MLTQLIISADDFGASEAVNAAVVKARRHGMLTSASLMVTGSAVREAVAIAGDDPGLAVGLHLTLSDGRSLLPPAAIPDIVSETGEFLKNPVTTGLKYFFDQRARRQLRLEIEAQFEAFAETGIRLSHVDGHQNLHAHPVILPVVIELATRHGAHGIRVPHDPLLPNIRADRSHLARKAGLALAHAYLARVCTRQTDRTLLARCEVSIGSLMSGRMNSGYVMRMLQAIDCRSAEIYFHPADLPEEQGCDSQGPNAGDLRALLDPALREFIAEGGVELTNYEGIKRGREGGKP